MDRNRLTVFDTTLRDGEQAPGFSMRIHEKVRLARQLDALGVDIIEAGFPIASEADAEAVKAVAAAVRRPDHRRAGPRLRRRHRQGRRGPRAAPRGRASTPSSPRPTCTSSAS